MFWTLYSVHYICFAHKLNIFELFMTTEHKCVSCQKPMPYVENTSTSSLFLKCNVGNMFHKSQMMSDLASNILLSNIISYRALCHVKYFIISNILSSNIISNKSLAKLPKRGVFLKHCFEFHLSKRQQVDLKFKI